MGQRPIRCIRATLTKGVRAAVVAFKQIDTEHKEIKKSIGQIDERGKAEGNYPKVCRPWRTPISPVLALAPHGSPLAEPHPLVVTSHTAQKKGAGTRHSLQLGVTPQRPSLHALKCIYKRTHHEKFESAKKRHIQQRRNGSFNSGWLG